MRESGIHIRGQVVIDNKDYKRYAYTMLSQLNQKLLEELN
jgi:hypothetical protein